MESTRIDREAFEVWSKGWDWSKESIQDPWHAGFHSRAARTRAKRAFLTSYYNIYSLEKYVLRDSTRRFTGAAPGSAYHHSKAEAPTSLLYSSKVICHLQCHPFVA